MNLDTLKTEVKKDLTIDKTDLASESIRIPQIHNKYLNFLMNDRLSLSKFDSDLVKLRHKKWLYYTGKMSQEELDDLGWDPFDLTVLKTDIDKFVNADDDVILLQHKVVLLREKVNYLEGVMKAINNLNWNIRSAIDWMRMTEFAG
jgi:hypothetical protein|tara:strand:+ start:354 stop:791 length:438 start_codon:yes stop_codon:yes gene_type:complete